MAEYVRVALLSELEPGSCKTVEAGGKEIALFNVEGTIYAVDNTCLHQGGPLGDGMLEGDIVTCPWHMWQYNVRTGEHLSNKEFKVAPYAVRVDGNEIMVAV